MKREQFQRVEALYHEAKRLPPEDRAAFLDSHCADDPAVRAELELLLGQHSIEARELRELGGIAHPPSAGAPAEGTRVGPYKLLRRIGEGGMGTVYEAEQETPVRRRVALKLVKWGMDTEQVVARFESERQALALMNHPNIARVYDAGATDQGRPFFAMEHVKGVAITEYCDTQRLRNSERLELFTQVCEGVEHAHHKGVIHRDIKPSNVLVMIQEGRPVPKIIDFGVAKATSQRLTERTVFTELGQLIGTPEYMSPEQAEMSGLDVDTRTDVYALGVMLYELLTGALPFEPEELRASGFDEIRRKIREDEPPRPSTRVSRLEGERSTLSGRNRRTENRRLVGQLRGDLDWITMRALEKDRTRRYASPRELAKDVIRHLRDEPVDAGPPGVLYRAGKLVRRHKLGVAASVALGVMLLVLVVSMAIQAARIKRERDQVTLERGNAEQVSEFLVELFEVSDPSETRGNSVTAREILDRGADRIRDELSDQPLLQARLTGTIGRVYTSLGLYDEAEPLLRDALEARLRLLGPTNLNVARSRKELGNALVRSGDFAAAREQYEQALETQETLLGDHRETANTLQVLASILRGAGEPGAEALEKRALTMLTEVAPDDPERARALANLARTMAARGDHEQARSLAEEAVALVEVDPDVGPLRLAGAVVNLGVVLGRVGDPVGSLQAHERALDIFKRTLGPDHPDTLLATHNVASAMMKTGDREEARKTYETLVARLEGSIVAGKPVFASILTNMANLLRDEGEHREAERRYRRAITIREEALGPHNRGLLGPLREYAKLLREVGRDEEAADVEKRMKAIRDHRPAAAEPR